MNDHDVKYIIKFEKVELKDDRWKMKRRYIILTTYEKKERLSAENQINLKEKAMIEQLKNISLARQILISHVE